ncbi:palmitoyltransferase ZDHHC24 [Biomphalaria pfeifferi]|uniref:Palmitoyltransferase n=1 Tax=Biomphalaria pfeifferi TaxID=112525 RepID=A0AAD8F374_BIOPF|nr:palmitoyltransferase ZDHHC24 [Biomphalaria pfeifferi]
MNPDLVGRSNFTFIQTHGHFQPYDSPMKEKPPNSALSTVLRSARLEMGGNREESKDRNVSLMQKLKAHYQKKSSSDTNSKYLFRILFQFQAITQLYMTLTYLVPHVFSNCDPMSQYYLKVLVCYVFAMGQANWLCSICYSNRLPDLNDRPDTIPREWMTNYSETNGQDKLALDSNGLEWRFCTECQRYKPPRSHHCLACKTCILRRDHHCFLIGTCVGHYNQRYFIVFCFLGVITGLAGFYMTLSYLRSMSEAYTWLDYIFPWSLFKFVIGRVSWQFLLLTFHAEMLAVFGTMSVIYSIGQFTLVSMGMTLYEVAKQVDVKISSSRGENLRMVFGDYWAFNFLFPGQILFKQRHDGIHFNNITINGHKVSIE